MTVESTVTIKPPPEELAAIESAATSLHDAGPRDILDWLFQRYPQGVTLASAFGNTSDIVLMDMVAKAAPGTEVFYLDTDFLFEETYDLIERSRAFWPDLDFREHRTHLTPEQQALEYGEALWERQPDLCCDIRKVQPIHTALEGKSAWITGVRRDQAASRANAPAVGWDAKFGLAKANPLVTWDEKQAWAYIFEHDLPYNLLHDQGYPTLGCTHCTRAVQPGEDQRAGRWAGTGKLECGLHSE
ncbi:MAG: phosphoadenylyl-sulfate reductase [Dehalococcoidia bacterium]|nr:phosphoadenylyl-sulfate reductase [Dehalococcoidia bacterium]